MDGKVSLVTGATNGIGAVTARELARMGSTVVGIGRNADRCAAREREIRQLTRNQSVRFFVADLSSQAEVRDVASRFLAEYPSLHVLVNNVGGIFPTVQRSADGIELTLALNHLAPFLLTHLLLDRIKASAPARIVVVSSGAHVGATVDFDRLQGPPGMGGLRTYGQSKLANLYFTYELAKRLAGTGVTVNALHPGVVATNFGRGGFGLMGRLVAALMPISNLFALSEEDGAKTSLYLAASPEVEGVTGKYFVKQRAVASSETSYDEATARRLWDLSLQMTGLSG
jgi:NAD(P)-dependent dehydrogenase (short-subunit alcohol dehydrogenase family)